jgi:tetratricopeptide (TPR) repeat protein
MAMSNDDLKIIFTHIFKAGGTTLRHVLANQYGEDAVYEINYDYNNPHPHSRFEYRNLTMRQRSRIKVVTGHMPYSEGLHYCLTEPYVYITLLRDPIERTISEFYFIHRNTDTDLRRKIVRECPELKDFLESGYSQRNYNIRYFASCEVDCSLKIQPEWILSSAKHNLREHYNAVGVTERYDEFVILLRRLMKWENYPFYTKQNITPGRPKREEIDPHVLRMIEDYNRQDLEFYNYAISIFEDQISNHGESFLEEINTFRELNQALNDGQLAECMRLTQMGVNLFSSGELAQAREVLEKASDMKPQYPSALNNLGVVLLQMGALNQAHACLAKAVQLDPDNRKYILNFCTAIERTGTQSAVTEICKKYFERHPGDQELGMKLSEMGVAQIRTGPRPGFSEW